MMANYYKNLFTATLYLFLSIYCNGIEAVTGSKDWSYALLNAEMVNEKPEGLTAYMKQTKVSRGVYSLSGNCTILTDLLDENAIVEVDIFRSARNDDQYQQSPVSVKGKGLFDFMNNEYKKFLMNSAQECSNFPLIEEDITSPVPIGTFYHFENCLLKDDTRLPNHVQPGFYKIVATLTRDPVVKLRGVLYLEISPKVM